MQNDDMRELTPEQLDAQLAVFTAVQKVATAGKKRAMDEATLRLREQGKSMKRQVEVSGVPLGYLTKAKDSITVYDEDEYGLWAAEHNRGRKLIQVDVTDDPELEKVLTEWLEGSGVAWRLTGKADPDLKKGLVVRGSHVISWDGEVVPGAGVKAGSVSYRDCNPHEVAKVLHMLGEADMSVAGFLGE